MRRKLDSQKLAQLSTMNELLDQKFGDKSSQSRTEFDAKARAWYYAEILKDARKTAGITQKELAEKIGKKREYVALLEKGETDMQLSTFILLTEAIGLRLTLT